MNIKLYVNNSDNNVINKNIVEMLSIDGYFRDPDNILNPNLTLEGDWNVIHTCNYVYIPQFARYYFIVDKLCVGTNYTENVRRDVITLSLKVDVLESFKTSILNQTAYIERQQNLWNLYLNDSFIQTQSNIIRVLRNFPNGLTDEELILIVAGNSDTPV